MLQYKLGNNRCYFECKIKTYFRFSLTTQFIFKKSRPYKNNLFFSCYFEIRHSTIYKSLRLVLAKKTRTTNNVNYNINVKLLKLMRKIRVVQSTKTSAIETTILFFFYTEFTVYRIIKIILITFLF